MQAERGSRSTRRHPRRHPRKDRREDVGVGVGAVECELYTRLVFVGRIGNSRDRSNSFETRTVVLVCLGDNALSVTIRTD